jgi:hypothetical protein
MIPESGCRFSEKDRAQTKIQGVMTVRSNVITL